MSADNLFTYGTLMLDEVIQALLGRLPASMSGTLCGHRRVFVRDKPFPGIYANSSSTVTGRVYLNIEKEEWPILDWFESDLYKRVHVKLSSTSERDEPASAWAYRIEPDNLHFLEMDRHWDLQEFIQEHAEAYIEMCKSCPAHYQALNGHPHEKDT